MTVTMLIIFMLLTLLGVPIAVALGIASLGALWIGGSLDLILLALRFFAAPQSFMLIAVPLFIFVGIIVTEGKASDILFDFADSLCAGTRGGLGYANVLGSMIFGGISGSSTADAAGLGLVEVRAMVARGYPRDWSAACTVASSTLAVVIPPSVIMVIYAVAASQSAVKCLVAGLLPGILITIGLMAQWYIVARKSNWPVSQPFSLRNIFTKLKAAWPLVLLPIVFLAGLLFGFLTPTEGASAIAIYSFILCVFGYRTVKVKQLVRIFVETAKITGSLLFMICTSSLASYIMSRENIPVVFTEWILSLTQSPVVILIFINIFLLILGCLMEGIVIVLLTTPVFLPLFVKIGIDPIHAGVIMITTLAIGLITPPVGVCLFATSVATEIPMEEILRVMPSFLLFLFITLVMINAFPFISLALPALIK